MWPVMMEMYLFDQLNVGLGRLNIAIPVVFVVIYYKATLAGSHYLRIMGSVLYKHVLLVLDILTVITRYLAYFLHFDPPTFDLFRETTRVYLELDAAEDLKQRRGLQEHVIRLRDENLRLTRMNAVLSSRLLLAESRSIALEVSMARQEQALRQRSLYVPSGQQPARHPSSSSLLRPRSVSAEETGGLARFATQEHQGCEPTAHQLLVPLLFFRRSAKELKKIPLQMALMQKKSQIIHEELVQHLLIELLSTRRDAKAIQAENRMRASLCTIVVRTQRLEMQRERSEHDKMTKCILIQMLTFRGRLLQHISARALSSNAASPAAPHNLIAKLEGLRLSEAQARAEKDSMAKCLSDVLASLPIQEQCGVVAVHDEPIVELVLALAFMWKARRCTNKMKLEQETMKAVTFGDIVDEIESSVDVNIERATVLGTKTRPHVVRAQSFNVVFPAGRSNIPVVNTPSTCSNDSSRPSRQPSLSPINTLPPYFAETPSLLCSTPRYSPVSQDSLCDPHPISIPPPLGSTLMSRGGSMTTDSSPGSRSGSGQLEYKYDPEQIHSRHSVITPNRDENLNVLSRPTPTHLPKSG